MVEVSEDYGNEVYEQGYNDAHRESSEATPSQLAMWRQQQHEAFNKFRLDSSDWIDRVVRSLAGQTLEVKNGIITGEWINTKPAVIGKDGVQFVSSLLSTYANKGTYLTYLETPTINAFCLELNTELSIIFMWYYKKYGIPKHMRRSVINLITNKVYLELNRARRGREASQISRSHQFIQHESYNIPKAGMMDKLKGFLGGKRR